MRSSKILLVVWLMVLAAIPVLTGGACAAQSVPILVYHRFGATATELTTIRTETFAQQLQWLHDNEVAVLPLHAVVDALKSGHAPGNGPAVVVTADDGHGSIYTDMYPLILRYRVPVTLFIYPSAISNSKTALTWPQISEMAASGLVDVQSHTYWHPDFRVEKSRLGPGYEPFVRKQLALSKTRIEEHTGRTVDLLAWPFGIHDAQLERLASESGYIAAFTIDRKRAQPGDDLLALPRFEVTDGDRGARFARLVRGDMAAGAGG
jgi:peptidoglycan/xylan/chitin deacetylase (PgdA/CDA1 family)